MFSKISQIITATGIMSLISLAGVINPVVSQSISVQEITFACGITRINGKDVPTTVAYIPGQRKRRIITWTSHDFDKTMTIEKRCQAVSQNFQKAYNEGRLKEITFGENRGYPIVCAVENRNQSCNGKNQLFTLKQGSQPEAVMKKLMDILEGRTSATLFQSSGEQVYVSFEEWLKVAPEIEEEN